MKKQDVYLKLLISTYEEIQTSDTELTIEGKKYMFREIILRKFLEDDQAYFINDEADFINDCKTSLSKLKEEFSDYINHIRNKKLDVHLLAINFGLRDNDLIDYGNTNLNRRIEIKSKTDNVNKRYGNNYLTNKPISNFTDIKICLEDIEFMQASLVDNNLRELQQFVKSNLSNNLPSGKQAFEKHNEIFSNNGFELFEHILETYVRKDWGRKDDVSYYYRRMHQDKFIHQSSEPFKTWFEENYEELGKIKTLIALNNTNRNNLYMFALERFKSRV